MDLEQKSIERIKMASEMSLHHYGKPLICTYSGGKDSDVMLELFKRSGVPFEVHNSHTTVDAPPTVYHIRDVFRDLELMGIHCDINYHRRPDGHLLTMWNLIPNKLMPPTRIARYCCKELKEGDGANRMIATGVRWAESVKRRGREAFEYIASTKSGRIAASTEVMLANDNDTSRRLIEKCEMKAKTVCNPIIDWKDPDIWDFYWHECKHHNPLYQMGYTRVGCIGCPLAGKKERVCGFPDIRAGI
jgi:3'-phosphoadenosine 5'-phosphosulfate sulfotransferase (PAPS reductase)/FAD synthetase